MMKQIGIWLDYKEAYLIELNGSKVDVLRVESAIEDFHPKGGARSKSPWGPMDTVSESKYLERRKHQESAYFQKLLEAVNEVDELYIFGPAEAKNKFLKTFKKSSGIRPLMKGIESADSMTENQRIAKVKAFFNR